MTKAEEETHVVMLPWLAFGHMIPFLELSCALANRGIHVSYVSTPRNIQKLHKIPPNLSPFIHFVAFPLPPNHLPDSAEATVDIPTDKIDCLKIAYDLLQEPIRNFIAEKQPNWIVVDFIQHWAADISQELNIPLVSFNMFCASTNVYFGGPDVLTGEGQVRARPSPESMTMPPPWVNFPSKVEYKYGEAIYAHRGFYGMNASGISDSARIAKLIRASRVLAFRTCPEFDGEYLNLYSEVTGKPVIPVGFLTSERNSTAREEPWSGIFKWLDKQEPRSVVFVGFGSETKLGKQQICEIAYGLEISGLRFIWAVAKPVGMEGDLDALLPPGFCSRTAAQGVVQMGWAPQREILGHASIWGSFFHAGWGSIIEALQFGHVLVVMPLIIDQPLNARLMVEKDLGVEVERGEDGSISRDEIAAALKKAMASEELRERAKAAGGIFGDRGLSQSHLDKFAEYLKNGDKFESKHD